MGLNQRVKPTNDLQSQALKVLDRVGAIIPGDDAGAVIYNCDPQANHRAIARVALLRKLALVREYKQIPKPIEEIITLTNMIRNAMAHSFFPMNKKDFRRTEQVTYKGKDLYTLDGLKLFNDDANRAVGCLSHLLYGVPEIP
jgi:hypothetical protein